MNTGKARYNFLNSKFKKGFIWNLFASVLYSGTSVVLLWLIIRICGTDAGGLFSITFSSAQFLQSIGYFGIRNFQVSDTKPAFSFSVYLSSRNCYVLIMLLLCFIYAWVMRFEGEKLTVFIAFALTKAVEAIADVLEGFLHQQNHLDMASKSWLLRSSIALIGFVFVILTTKSLLLAAWAMLLGTVIATFFFSTFNVIRFTTIHCDFNKMAFINLTRQCLPLFLSTGMLLYLNNAAKIAIDQNLDDFIQAKFGIVFMPAFVVNLICGFLFRPLLGKMALLYYENKKIELRIMNRHLFFCVGGISTAILVGGYLWGIPILSTIYSESISEYREVLMIVLIGGCLCAFVNLFNQILTVMRRQTPMVIAYAIICVITFSVSNVLTQGFGVLGAAFVYLISMFFLTIFLAFAYFIGY